MFLADVIGTVVSPIQTPILDGRTLLLLRPLTPAGSPQGIARIGIDNIGAGVGDRVLVVDEGNAGRQLMGDPNGPVKTIVLGIVDFIEIEGEHVYEEQRRDQVARITP